MVDENPLRNAIIYDLWLKGYTIDKISFDTGIPRSTVGYYIHKFNKSSKKGEPIVFQAHGKLDPKALAINALIKSLMLNQLTETIKSGDIDKVYKVLSVYKLVKELERDLLPTPEEIKSFYENLNYVIQQWINMTKVVS